jgi:hypothetical protein
MAMMIRRILAAIAVCLVLVLVASISLIAQTRTGSAKPPQPVPPPGTRFAPSSPVPAGGTPYSPSIGFPVQNAYASQSVPGSLAPPRVPGTPVPSLPARLELASGLSLTGQVPAESLPCQATFGEVSIPLAKVRGLRLHDPDTTATDKEPAGPAATIVLDNSDSLTVTLRAELIHVKTDWGMAIVEVPHVRSLILTADAVQWQQSGGRWHLSPVDNVPDEAKEAPSESAAAPHLILPGRIIIQEEEETKLGIELEP